MLKCIYQSIIYIEQNSTALHSVRTGERAINCSKKEKAHWLYWFNTSLTHVNSVAANFVQGWWQKLPVLFQHSNAMTVDPVRRTYNMMTCFCAVKYHFLPFSVSNWIFRFFMLFVACLCTIVQRASSSVQQMLLHLRAPFLCCDSLSANRSF